MLESEVRSVPDKTWCNILKEKSDLTLLKKPRHEAESSLSSLTPDFPMELPIPPQPPTALPPPPMLADKKHSTPNNKKGLSGNPMATLLDQFQQSHSCNASPAKNNTPKKHSCQEGSDQECSNSKQEKPDTRSYSRTTHQKAMDQLPQQQT